MGFHKNPTPMKLKYLIIAIITLCSSLPIQAQQGTVVGRIRDLITENGVDSCAVVLLNADSTRVGACFAIVELNWTQIDGRNVRARNAKDGATFKINVPRPGRYILRCMAGGYRTTYFPIEAKYSATKTTFDAGDFYLQEMSTRITEAVVTGTKIRMFYKGDTLVYNASAFQLPDGSMLDDLVKQLPGAELRDGNIYVNGRLVENLLLGGKDFFNGDPQAALANLPAYVINNVKVYEKRGEKGITAGKDMGDNQFVMDVHLKRKYVGTFMGQLTAGYGTDDRYQAGLFLMRFDERQSFSIAGDFNNRNLNCNYSRYGMSGKTDASGKHKRNHVSLNYQFEPHGRLRFLAAATYDDHSSHNDGGTSREYYLTGGNTFSRSQSASYASDMTLGGNTRLVLRPQKSRYFELSYSVNYDKRDGHSSSRSANYNGPLPTMDFYALLDSTFTNTVGNTAYLQSILQSRLQNEAVSDGKNLRHTASAQMHQTIAGNLLWANANVSASNNRDHRYDLYKLDYGSNNAAIDFRHRFQDLQTLNQQYGAKAGYDWNYMQTPRSEGRLAPFYEFHFSHSSSDHPVYRLDSLGGDWSEFNKTMLGSLPSVREEWMQTLSNADSYWSELDRYRHVFGVRWHHEFQLHNDRWMKMDAKAEMTRQSDRYSYQRYGADHPVERSSWLPSPSLKFTYIPVANDRRGLSSAWELSWSSTNTQVQPHQLLNITDTADPLYIQQGNPHLSNPWAHRAGLTYKRQLRKRQGHLMNSLNWTQWQKEVAMSTRYDRTTGVRTTTPVNINGNWRIDYATVLNIALDKEQRWILWPIVSANYNRSVDLNHTTDAATSATSIVKSLGLAAGANIQARPTKWLNFSGGFKADWNRVSGSQASFATIHATTLIYNLQTTVFLPAKLVLNAGCDVTSRFGFSDSSLNDTRATLNASLERTIKQFTLKVQGCDLLARNRYTTSVMNVQGRTETFATTLPRYALFSLTWKFNKVPKRK